MEDDAAWFEAWKASGIDQQVFMPYFSQLDNKTGYRDPRVFLQRCSHGGGVSTKLSQMMNTTLSAAFGDTTSIEAHLKTLESLGLNARFSATAIVICLK